MKKMIMCLFVISCNPGVTPENQCQALTTCDIDLHSKAGPKGDKGPQGERGEMGPSGKPAGPVVLRSLLQCSTTFAGYRFTYVTKLFSNDIRFTKCNALSINNEYSSSDFNDYALGEAGYATGNCQLYGANIDCHDPVGVWTFRLTKNGLAEATYNDPNSSYNGTVITFYNDDCIGPDE